VFGYFSGDYIPQKCDLPNILFGVLKRWGTSRFLEWHLAKKNWGVKKLRLFEFGETHTSTS
jgi:hypothetical protein